MAHDCQIGESVILSNNVMLAGHCQIGDFAIVGGGAAAHQFVRIGAHAFVGGLAGVEHDLIPFGMALGNRAALAGLNFVGLKRRGFSREAIHELRRAYKMLFNGKGTLQGADRRRRGRFSQPGGRAADRRLSSPGRRPGDLRPASRQGRRGVKAPAGGPIDAGTPPLAILCGAGAFPLEVAADARAAGRAPFLIGVVGSSEPTIETYPHVWVRMGELGKLFAALKERAIGEIVLVGAMTRPEFADLRLDWGAVKRAAGLAQLFRRGDNGLLAGLAAIFERERIRVVGAHEAAPRLVASAGAIGARAPSPDDETDIAFGAALLDALSDFDAGQGAVVAAGRVLAVEAAEGTDAMLARVADMRANGRLSFKGPAGVMVKAPKRGQDLRLDMPAIGEDHRRSGQRAVARRGARRRPRPCRRARTLRPRGRRGGPVRHRLSRVSVTA